jgi:hypothetical protein
VKDLVVGSGIAFEDRGMHALKGVPGEWHLFAVAPADEVIEYIMQPMPPFVAVQESESGTQRPWRHSSNMSAVGGKAAVPSRCRDFSV